MRVLSINRFDAGEASFGAPSQTRLRSAQVSGPVLLLGVATGYLALAQFVVWFNDPVNLGAGFWPAAGLSLALLVLVRLSRWGWVLAGVAIAELGGDLAHCYPLDATLWWTASNCIEPVVGATLLRVWANPGGLLVPLRQFRRFFGPGIPMRATGDECKHPQSERLRSARRPMT